MRISARDESAPTAAEMRLRRYCGPKTSDSTFCRQSDSSHVDRRHRAAEAEVRGHRLLLLRLAGCGPRNGPVRATAVVKKARFSNPVEKGRGSVSPMTAAHAVGQRLPGSPVSFACLWPGSERYLECRQLVISITGLPWSAKPLQRSRNFPTPDRVVFLPQIGQWSYGCHWTSQRYDTSAPHGGGRVYSH